MELVINDRITNRKITFFESFDITLRYDAVASTFSFSFLFDPNNPDHKDLAAIGHYHIASLYHNKELLLTGYILSESLTDEPSKVPVTISGYSLPGVLEDCQIPTTSYPIQFDGLTLAQISSKVLAPFGIKQIVNPSVASDMNSPYVETEAKSGQTIRDILVDLATQKNIIISHDEQGRLVYTRPSSKQKPIFNFESNIPQTSMKLTFDGQGMHSDITVFQQKDFDVETPATTVAIKNPYVPFVYRPHVVSQTSGNANDTQKAAENIRARELKGMTLQITTDRWIIDNKVIRPGQLLTAINPAVYLYKKSTWFIESVRLKGDSKETIATLGCVLPEVYSGETPTYLFKGINLR